MCFYPKTESRKRKESRIEGYTHKEVLHSRPGERKWKFQRKMRKINSERLGGNWEREMSRKPKVDTEAGKKKWCHILQ